MDKICSNGEMVDILTKDTRKKAYVYGKKIDSLCTAYINMHGNLVWESDNSPICFYDDRLWGIIEPPKTLKEISTQEMAKHYSTKVYDTPACSIKSVVTDRTLDRTQGFAFLTEEEIDGLWTVEGLYED